MSDKTIAQQLKIKKFPFEIKDDNGNKIYHEDSNGYWWKKEYDDANNLVYCECSDGCWCKKEFDAEGNEVYYEGSDGYWEKREFDDNGNQIYCEDSDGYISDKRPKSKAMAKVEQARKLLQQAEKELKEVHSER